MTLSLSDPVRLHQAGAGLERRLEPDATTRAAIARELDLQALPAFVADMKLAPISEGWRLDGRVSASAVQTCGVTLEPLPVEINQVFSLRIVEAADTDSGEIVIDLEGDDPPDVATDGRIDLGQYAVEQLALALDPFPRKPGANFTPSQDTEERSPFAVLRQLKPEGG